MAMIVVGGHSRSVGKTSVVASLISHLPEFPWTAIKVTQFGHSVCSVNGEPCDCQTESHAAAFSEEKNAFSGSDTSRYLAAGAVRSLWVRTRQGQLATAMTRLRREIAAAPYSIVESNSIVGFLKPELYLVVLDPAREDFKDSARFFLDRADAILMHASSADLKPLWKGVSLRALKEKPQFLVNPPSYISAQVVDFVRSRIAATPAFTFAEGMAPASYNHRAV